MYPGAKVVPGLVAGGTDARFYRLKGAVAYGAALFSPEVSMESFGQRFHGNDERIDVESLGLSTEFWYGVVTATRRLTRGVHRRRTFPKPGARTVRHMVYPPYSAPFPDVPSAPHTLGSQQRAMLTLMAQKPGRLVTREELAAKLGLPQLTPRRAEVLVDGINDVLGPDTITPVPRRGWLLTRYPAP